MAVVVLLEIFLEKYNGKSKEQNTRKMGEILEKWVVKGWNLVYLAWQKSKYSKRTATSSIYAPGKVLQDRDTLIEQSPCYRTVTYAWMFQIQQ